MGTRSLTFIYDESKNPIMNMYRQYDGYPSGHGMQLAQFLNSGKMVNGYSASTDRQFNGMGCLAAQLVSEVKHGVGGFYLYPVNSRDCGQEYEYHVYTNKVVVTDGWTELFNGTWKKFQTFCGKN